MTITYPPVQRRYDDDSGVDVSTVIIAFICIGLVFLFIVLPMSLCCYCNYKRKSRAMVISARSRITSPHIPSREVESGRREESQSPDGRLSNIERPEAIPNSRVIFPHLQNREVEIERREENRSSDERLSIAERPEAIPLSDMPPPPYKERDEGEIHVYHYQHMHMCRLVRWGC